MANEVKVRPHPAAGTRVVLPGAAGEDKEPVVVEGTSTVPESLFKEAQKKENYGRPTQGYPDGYPLIVKEGD